MKHHQSTLSTQFELLPGVLDKLLPYLKEINSSTGAHSDLSFDKISGLHFARIVVVPPSEPEGNSSLLLSTNFDGNLDEHLADLEKICDKGLRNLFKFCKGFTQSNNIKDFIKDHALYTPTFYQGTLGIRADMIRKQKNLDNALQDIMNKNSDELSKLPSAEVHQYLREKIKDKKELSWAFTPPLDRYKETLSNRIKMSWLDLAKTPSFVFLIIVLIGLLCSFLYIARIVYNVIAYCVNHGFIKLEQLSSMILNIHMNELIIFLLAFLPLTIIFVVLRALRKDEISSPISRDMSFTANSKQLEEEEDFIVQNALTSLTITKPGKLRLQLIKLVFCLITLLARWVSNKGFLGGIPSIHFAKWFLIDNGKRVVFFSNYDGSWENYLSDFVDKAAVGLTGVWSNAINFPRTTFLFLRGARYETSFKIFARISNLSTYVWYSAYKDLSSMEVNNNYEVHKGFAKEKLSNDELKVWLPRL